MQSPRSLWGGPLARALFAIAVVALIAGAGALSGALAASHAGGAPGTTSLRGNPSRAPSYPALVGPPYVANTLVLASDRLVPGNYLANNSVLPVAVVYDSGKAEAFVANSGSNNVSVMLEFSKKVLANVTVGDSPEALAYDNATGEVFVTDQNSNAVSVINDSTNSVVATITVGSAPYGIAYDWAQAELFVANSGSNNVSVINATTDLVVANISVQADPQGVAYDPGAGAVFVADSDTDNATVINATNDSVAATVPVGFFPEAVAYDNGTAQVFVTNAGSNNVTVINDSNDSVAATVNVGASPQGAVYDPLEATVFVVNSGSADVSVVADANDTVVATVPVGYSPQGATYDPVKEQILVANYAGDSVSVIGATTNHIVTTVGIGSGPFGVTYDAGKGQVLVANSGSARVNVVDGTTNTIVTNVPVGNHPEGIAYDGHLGQFFVANQMSGTVGVFSDATDRVVATVLVGIFPVGVAYDKQTAEVFVANEVSGTLSVINASSDTVAATITVPSYPSGITYDEGNGELYVPHFASDNVSVINGTTNHVGPEIQVGTDPAAVAYDSGTGELFVANGGSNNVSVVNTSTNTVSATIPVGSVPDGLAYDPATGDVFVANGGSNNVTVISDSSDSAIANLSVGADPIGVAYDAATSQVDVANYVQGTLSILEFVPATTYPVTFSQTGLPAGTVWSVTVDGTTQNSTGGSIAFSEPNGTSSYSIGGIAGWHQSALPYSGTVTVSGSAVTEPTMVFTNVTYRITFSESGLPNRTSWSVTFNGTRQSSTGTLMHFTESNGTYSYTIGAVNGWNQTTLPHMGTVAVNGSDVVEPTLAFSPFLFSVTFSEAGLPNGTAWSITFNGTQENSTTSTISFSAGNGTYSYSIAPVSGWLQSTLPYSGGSVTVNGAAVTEPTLVFVQLVYLVTFTESGLPNGTVWSVTLNASSGGGSTVSSNTTSLSFSEPNGSYTYSITPISGWGQATLPYSGPLNVSGAAVTEPTLAFTQVLYNVTFSQSGLPAGTPWSVTLDGALESSVGGPIVFAETNGSFLYTISSVSGWHQSTLPYTGPLNVTGASVTEPTLVFTQVFYTVTFSQTGLPAGTTWSVTLNGTFRSSMGSSISFTEANATYSYTIGSIAGWFQSALPYSGAVTVSGASLTEPTLAFAKFAYTVTFAETGLPSGTAWSVTLQGVSHNSTTSSIVFTEPNGTYTFTILPVAGYVSNITSGSVTVPGSVGSLTEKASFASVVPQQYTVTVTETGLPAGTSWSVTFNGTTTASTSSSITFTVPNGTYVYSIGSVAGYSANQTSGSVTVSGSGASVTIGFTSNSSTSPSGLPILGYLLIALAVVVIVAVALWASRGRKGNASSETNTPKDSEDAPTESTSP
jgi:YVTN family beta-propeller protein